MSLLCRLGLHAWRCTDWTDAAQNFNGTADVCARCRRIRGTHDVLRVERTEDRPVVVPAEERSGDGA